MGDASEFKGQDVLLVGTSYRAEDLASQAWKYGAKSVTISHRTQPIGYTTWPDNVHEVPLLQVSKTFVLHLRELCRLPLPSE
jgi:trimethylamine monooxygenase